MVFAYVEKLTKAQKKLKYRICTPAVRVRLRVRAQGPGPAPPAHALPVRRASTGLQCAWPAVFVGPDAPSREWDGLRRAAGRARAIDVGPRLVVDGRGDTRANGTGA